MIYKNTCGAREKREREFLFKKKLQKKINFY